MRTRLTSRVPTLIMFIALATITVFVGCANSHQSDTSVQPSVRDGGAKYVFLFIGDGMAIPQVHATELYRNAVRLRDAEVRQPGSDRLVMTQLPVHGMCTTYSANHQTTDSAAAGTALATGHKTNSGMISVTPDERPLVTIAQLAKANGKKVGVITDVPVNHATPAAFYAHQKSRGQLHEIAMQIPGSCVDFLAGSSLGGAEGPQGNAIDAAKEAGFRHVTSREELLACRPGDRVLSITPEMTFVTDRKPDAISLAELTRTAINLLDSPRGFFIMVEGGRIDWAGHANEPKSIVDEVQAFDDAIAEAVDFYRRHPGETLIVVTSDHETGGMSMATNGRQSASGMADLAKQQKTYGRFNSDIFEPWKAEQHWNSVEDNIPAELKQRVSEVFGLDWDSLGQGQMELLEMAYDRSMGGDAAGAPLYGKRPAFPVAISRVLSERAGISWTTFGHSPVTVPVFAGGASAYRFGGALDNTDIPRRLAQAMRLEMPQQSAGTVTVTAAEY